MANTSQDMITWLSAVRNVAPTMPDNVKIAEVIEKGGQGLVYRGWVDEEEAAIKIYFPGQLTTRIDRERQALTRIDCPAIVKLLWSDRLTMNGEQLNVVATSFVQGSPLNQVISISPLDQDSVGRIIYDIAAAIDAMWQYRIVHRDLKPSNILVRPSGRACVIDLGVARHLGESSLTNIGATWGTFGYLSPEQARAVRQLTCKSDIYALAVVALEAGMGRHPANRDQDLLLQLNLHDRLPAQIREWRYASLLQDMLHPRATARPMPDTVLSTLERYTPGED